MNDSPPPSPLAQPVPWELVANDYAAEVTPIFEAFAEAALQLAGVGPGMQVADVASGPGTLTLLALRRGADVKAIDFAAPMIELLRARLDDEQARRVDATVGDGMALPWPDAQLDAGFSMFGLMFFPDRARGFRELARVLRPGAPAVVSSWVSMERIPILAAAFGLLEELMPGPKSPPRVLPLVDADSCRAEMAAGGFDDVEVREHAAAFEIPSMTDFVASMERTNAPVALAKRRLGADWPPLAAALRDRMVERFGDGARRVDMIANLISGRRRGHSPT